MSIIYAIKIKTNLNFNNIPKKLKMGRIFLHHCGGNRLYSCANCDTVLTNKNELVSARFNGSTGRAYLFKSAVNLYTNEVQERVMLTG